MSQDLGDLSLMLRSEGLGSVTPPFPPADNLAGDHDGKTSKKNRPPIGDPIGKRFSVLPSFRRSSSRSSERKSAPKISHPGDSGGGPDPNDPDDTKHRDPLPQTKKGLEGLLNFHLSSLDRVVRNVRAINDQIAEHKLALRGIQDFEDMAYTIVRLSEMIKETQIYRNALGRHIGYHRIEIERVVEEGLKLKKSGGEDLTVPESALNLPGEIFWRSLFLS